MLELHTGYVSGRRHDLLHCVGTRLGITSSKDGPSTCYWMRKLVDILRLNHLAPSRQCSGMQIPLLYVQTLLV